MKKTIILTGQEQVDLVIDIISSLYDAQVRSDEVPLHQVAIKPHKSSRSLAQNNLFHMWCRQVSLDYAETYGQFYSPAHWKIYFKEMFLGYESVEINGKIINELRQTSKLNVKQFSEFLEQVDMYSGSEFSIVLPHPEDLYREAMRK